jgi:hypothetical protein
MPSAIRNERQQVRAGHVSEPLEQLAILPAPSALLADEANGVEGESGDGWR